MSYTREERLDIGKQIYNNEISKSDAAIKYRISEGTARDYMRLYRDVNGLPPKNRIQKVEDTVKICTHSSEPDLSEYESMTKEELIQELVKSRISVLDGELRETQTANYFSDVYPVDCAVPPVNALFCRKHGTLLSAGSLL